MTTLYGIKNCDTVKKARKWLEQHQHNHQFHDFRTDGLDKKSLATWLKKAGKDTLINRRSTTWKQLSEQEKAYFEDDVLGDEALQVVLTAPTLLKRPLLVKGSQLLVGFKELDYKNLFS